jgi:NAD(P)-dependent dehydrogenase (short-subunit alcohol dehydrogenase family)
VPARKKARRPRPRLLVFHGFSFRAQAAGSGRLTPEGAEQLASIAAHVEPFAKTRGQLACCSFVRSARAGSERRGAAGHRTRMGQSSKLGARSTAEDALAARSLNGKIAIVTGANSGIGTETARVLALGGAHVLLACRSLATGEEAAKTLRASLPAGAGAVEVLELDLAHLESVRAFAERFLATGRPLHILVNNAGVMATPLGKTAQGHELQSGINHVGHFLLTKLLRPRLEASAPSRIVNVSSAMHSRGRAQRLLDTLERDPGFVQRKYVPFDAYGDSKLANVLFTHQLAKVLPSSVEAFSLHPGVIPTNLTRSMGFAGSVFRTVGKLFMKTIPQGAATSVYAATAPELAGRSGSYLADCAIVLPSTEGRNGAIAAKLWAVTEQLVAAS